MCARTRRKNKDGSYKYYYSPLNENGTNITSVWNDIYHLTPSSKERKNVNYDTQKPKKLIERIIKASSNEGDIVADFFCGSGTTGVVAKELGRDYILCDINPKAIEISESRIYEI
jgi:DNA modification methylase